MRPKKSTKFRSISKKHADPNLAGLQRNVTRLDFQPSLAKRGTTYVGKGDKRILHHDLMELR